MDLVAGKVGDHTEEGAARNCVDVKVVYQYGAQGQGLNKPPWEGRLDHWAGCPHKSQRVIGDISESLAG